MHTPRHHLAVMALLIFSMLAASCGSSTSGTSVQTAPASQPASNATAAPQSSVATTEATSGATSPESGQVIELRVAWWGSQNRHDRTLKIIEMFQKEHPNIKITPEYNSWDDYWLKLTTQAAANNLPDVIQHDYQRINEWISRDLIIPLDDYIQSGQIDLANVDEKQIVGGRKDGKLYGVSLGTNALGMVFDPVQFEKAGLPLPERNWTWSDFERIATQLHEKLGIYGTGRIFYNNELLKMWLKSHGKWLYNDTGTALGYDDDKLFADFFHMILRMQKSGASPTREEDAAEVNGGIERSLLVSQRAAMIYIWSNNLVAVSQASKGRPFVLSTLPQVSDQPSPLYLKPSMFFTISSQSKHPKEAAMFIDYFTNSVEANKVLMADRGVPIATNVRQSLASLLDPNQKQMFEYIDLVEEIGSPINPPDPASHGKILSEVYEPIVDEILYGQITPEEGAKRFRERATAILAQK